MCATVVAHTDPPINSSLKSSYLIPVALANRTSVSSDRRDVEDADRAAAAVPAAAAVVTDADDETLFYSTRGVH